MSALAGLGRQVLTPGSPAQPSEWTPLPDLPRFLPVSAPRLPITRHCRKPSGKARVTAAVRLETCSLS